MALNDSPIQTGDGSSPWEDPKTWDEITFGGVTWYGKFELKGWKRHYKWDVKDAAGVEGATQTYRGKRPEAFSLAFFLWTPLMWVNWKVFSIVFQYSGVKGLVIPVDVVHPAINAAGLSQVVCEDLGILERVDDTLMYSVTLRMREYFPPLPLNATTTPPGAATTTPGGAAGTLPNPAIVALEAKIAALQAQASALGTPGGLPP